MTSRRRPRIALLAAPETSASVLYGLYDVLVSVGPVWPDMTTAGSADALLDVSIVAATAEPFHCYGGIPVEPHAAIAEVDELDAVVVCDMYTPIDTPPHGRYAAEIDFLRSAHERGVLIASVCSGSLLLAEAGLLDGRACAGHWAYKELFADTYPRITFRQDTILERAHEADGLVTAGGVTAWQELALYLVARFCGPAEAARTAKVYLLGGHDDGQLPFASMTRRIRTADPIIRECLAWVEEDPAVRNPVAAMTERSGLTSRTFARRFHAATGRRPIDYVHALRIERARELLEAGATATEDVGAAVGYEDPTFFRRLFRRVTGLSPAAYRRRYQPIRART